MNVIIEQKQDHLLRTNLFLSFLASFPERTFPNWFLRFLILSFNCFSLIRILFFFARTIIMGFRCCFYRFVVPPFFSFGLCLNFSLSSFTSFLLAFNYVFDIL